SLPRTWRRVRAGTERSHGPSGWAILLSDWQLPTSHRLGQALQALRRRPVSTRCRELLAVRDGQSGSRYGQSRRLWRHQGLASGLGRLLTIHVSELGHQVLHRRTTLLLELVVAA